MLEYLLDNPGFYCQCRKSVSFLATAICLLLHDFLFELLNIFTRPVDPNLVSNYEFHHVLSNNQTSRYTEETFRPIPKRIGQCDYA